MSERRAIVVGHRGQDGRLLVDLLSRRGVDVLGVGRTNVEAFGSLPAPPCRLDDPQSIAETIRIVQPHEIYYVAASHTSSQADEPLDVADEYAQHVAVNVNGPLAFLEAIRRQCPASRFFFASTSLIFGNSPRETPQNEETPACPEEAYAITKLLAGEACKDYRRHGVFASVGVLYNHESSYRPPHYLSMKVLRAALAAKAGATEPLVVGDLDATVDWGYAPDFVDAFTRIAALDEPGDFLVATGEAHSVREFIDCAFAAVGLDWRSHIRVDRSLLVRSRSGRVGDASKLTHRTNWRPTLGFAGMVAELLREVEANSSERTC